jgi:hypothetical protein
VIEVTYPNCSLGDIDTGNFHRGRGQNGENRHEEQCRIFGVALPREAARRV